MSMQNEECATFYPELLPWVSYCYGSHPLLRHPLGKITSECGVQQGDPWDTLLFSLALTSWYLASMQMMNVLAYCYRSGTLMMGFLQVNLTKCEYFGRKALPSFCEKLTPA